MKPFIIAEVGSNWITEQDCYNSITLAKTCGADAVKFQLFTFEELNGIPPKPGYSRKCELPPGWLPKLKAKADANGIKFMCTAFSVEGLHLVNKLVDIHKIASSDMLHIRMLDQVKRFGKPVLISTGGKSDKDIELALSRLGGCDVTILYCVANYPADIVDLREIARFKSKFDGSVGYSDHTKDPLWVPSAAMEFGATVIEKHVNFANVTSPDSPHSLSTDQFKLMCSFLSNEEACIHIPQRDMTTKWSRRIIATKNIYKDQKLEEGNNIGIYRSLTSDTKGMHPFHIDKLNGRLAKHLIEAGKPIAADMIEGWTKQSISASEKQSTDSTVAL